MKQTILEKADYQKGITRRMVLCAVLLVVTVIGFLVITPFQTKDNLTSLIMMKVCLAGVCGVVWIYEIDVKILPMRRMLQIFAMERKEMTGKITVISPYPQRYMKLNCYSVTVDTHNFFIPVGTIQLEPGTYQLSLVSGLIVAAERL